MRDKPCLHSDFKAAKIKQCLRQAGGTNSASKKKPKSNRSEKKKKRQKTPNNFSNFGNYFCFAPKFTIHQPHWNSSPKSGKKLSQDHCDQPHTFALSNTAVFLSFSGWLILNAGMGSSSHRQKRKTRRVERK